MQKQYGKTQAELETLVEGFSWALAEYSMQDIIAAIKDYIFSHSDIPAPFDIIKIIEDDRERNQLPPKTIFKIETLIRFKEMGIPLNYEDESRLRQWQDPMN